MGYKTYRLGGTDRYDTARLISFAATTGAPSSDTCRQANTADTVASPQVGTGFHNDAALEYHGTATTCSVLDQTVFLADGITGADALSVGWASSWWATPTLLTGPGGSLPAPTQSALQTLTIKHIVVLGGTARIPAATATQAAALAGVPAANVVRIGGADRYDTSVQLAQKLGGWYPNTTGASTSFSNFQNTAVCLAASAGEGDNGSGWPDSLGAGPYCGTTNGDTSDSDLTINYHQLPPTNGANPYIAGDSTPGHSAVPILLTTDGGALPGTVDTFLSQVYPATDTWCSSGASGAGDCNEPGFVYTFGGTVRIPANTERRAATLVSGGTYTNFSDLTPSIASFYTQLNMWPVYGTRGSNADTGENAPGSNDSGVNEVCFNRDQIKDVRFLSVYDDAARTIFDSEYDITNPNTGINANGSVYVKDTDGNSRSKGKSSPTCVRFDNAEAPAAAKGISSVSGMSISGHFTATEMFNYTVTKLLNAMTAQSATPPASFSGFDATQDDNAASAGMPFGESYSPTPTGSVFIKNVTCSITGAGELVSVNVTRGASTAPAVKDVDTFTASFTIPTSCGNLTGTVAGEAVKQNVSGGDRCLTANSTQAVWRLRGQATYTGATFTGTGGFSADLDTNNTAAFTDDAICHVAMDGLSA
jgi:hypothetical protein